MITLKNSIVISELIEKLEKIKEEEGDIEVRIFNDEFNSYDPFEYVGVDTDIGCPTEDCKERVITDPFVALG